MPMLKKGTGVVLVICSRCGFILEFYAMGDRENKKKYSGIPTPSKAIAPHGGRCQCGRELARLPQRVQVMSIAKFNDIYRIDPIRVNGRPLRDVYRLRRRDVSIVESQIQASTSIPAQEPIGIAAAAEDIDGY